MADDFLDKIVTIDVLTTLTGHTPTDPKDVIEDLQLSYDESILDKLYDYAVDANDIYLISDYAVRPLQELAGRILDASTAEAKLLVLDQVLNVVHRRSDLAALFVQGGREALEELSNQEALCATGE
jgi:hypothetical protein